MRFENEKQIQNQERKLKSKKEIQNRKRKMKIEIAIENGLTSLFAKKRGIEIDKRITVRDLRKTLAGENVEHKSPQDVIIKCEWFFRST